MEKTLYIFVLLLALFLVGCTEVKPVINQSKINELIEYIDDLSLEISESDEEYINHGLYLYDQLTEEEKKYISNYDYLLEAKEQLFLIKQEKSNIKEALEQTRKMLSEILPTILEENDDYIEFLSNNVCVINSKEYNVKIGWTSSDISIVSTTGKVLHDFKDVMIKLNANLYCQKETLTFEHEVLVKKKEFEELGDKQVVIGYYYGNYKPLTETDYKTLDIINYSFAQIKEENNKFFVDVKNIYGLSSFQEYRRNKVRVCLALGGWQDDPNAWLPYKNASKTIESRKQVANSILQVLEENGLDGIDMDWEYPTSSDRTNFTLLMKEIYNTLKKANKNYIVSIAIPAGTWIDVRYELDKLNECVDYFNVMSYDLESSSVTSHQSALYSSKYATASADTSVNYLIGKGVSKSKIVIGAAFYGKIYTGVENINHGLGQAFISKKAINYTLIYQNYLTRLNNGVTKYYDEKSKSYYLYDEENKVFICYDDVLSIKLKYQYAKDNNLGGLMYWCYNGDDTHQLMNAISEEIN